MPKNKILITLVLLIHAFSSFSQKTDSTKKSLQLKGAVTVTNKGISLIPTFTLGKPAAIFDLSLGKRKLFFEPQLRFALAGKPWSFIFWGRYKIVNNEKFKLTAGAHPSLVFRTINVPVNGVMTDVIQAHRYVAAELAPNYFISQNTSVGIYYLTSKGIDKGAVPYTHFITLNSSFSNIRLGSGFTAQFIPQFYYLKQYNVDGIYFTATLNINWDNFPLSFQSIINKELESEITGTKSFVWNVSLIYSFGKSYVAK